MSKTISIHSYRGGTGKSNLASSLAAILAQRGNRVGIVDTDIQSPGIHVLFGFDSDSIDRSINDFLWSRTKIEDTVYDVTSSLEGQGTEYSKLYLVPASANTADITRILQDGYDVELLNQGFETLIESFKLDYLLIDTHPGLNEETILSIAVSDALVLILRPDQQDYQGTIVTLDVARKLEVPQLFLVLNKVATSLDFVQLKKKVEATYAAEVVGVLPHSDEMMLLGSKGIFSVKYPDHTLTQILTTLAVQVGG